jgi:hypothetical protein
MNRPTSIVPALSPDEWAKHEPHQSSRVSRPKELAAVIALANAELNDADPRKLLRAHVKLLRRVADDHDSDSEAGQTVPQLLRDLADLIDSYLPPA